MSSRDPRDERTWDRFDTSEEPMYMCPYCELDNPEFMDCDCKASKRIRELEIELKVNVDALDEQTKKVRGMLDLLYYINQEVWTLIPLNKNIEFDFIVDEDFREFLEIALSDKEE